MVLIVLEMISATLAIYFACEYFTNSVEWLGRKFRLSQGAIGAVLAAFGTALPESVVTLSAVALGSGEAQKDIGVGAAVGGPLALSTIGYGLIAALVWRRAPDRSLGGQGGLRGVLGAGGLRSLMCDQLWFLALFAAATVLGALPLDGKFGCGLIFIAVYAAYARQELCEQELEAACGPHAPPDLAPLALRPGEAEPGHVWIWLQFVLSLAVIAVASRMFVQGLESTGAALGLAPQLTALLLSPMATELPETINGIVWVRQGKIRLALANISGAMMIQATIPVAFGMIFTPWLFATPVMIAALITLSATAAAFSCLLLLRPAPRMTRSS